jgi:phosphomannomutase
VPAVLGTGAGLPELPLEIVPLYFELDGTFPNHEANPLDPANLLDLQAKVVEVGADVGLAFDGDADRCFVVDERGRPVSPSAITALVAVRALAEHPGEMVIHNLITSRAVPEILREHGGVPVRSRVGHSFIKQVMAETGAAFGGEHSGHYYFRDNYRADSGIIATMLVLEQLSQAGAALSTVRKPFERYAASGEINTEVGDPVAVLERVADSYRSEEQDRLDGLTVNSGSWWFNLRPSNTEPLLRLNLEADDREACDRRVAEVLALITEP